MAEKICPTCHRSNRANAAFCIFCGTSLVYSIKSQPTTNKIDSESLSGEIKEASLGSFKTPEKGIALYVVDFAAPVAILEDQEFIVGRKLTDIKTEKFVDLTPYGGYENGISHRHAMIRQTAVGYEIIDLVSTNGTQVNNQQLIPLKPYPLHSGTQLRLGKLNLYAIFAAPKLKTDTF
jgi:hypothetical protein